ncbi:MAG: hypothetical protein IKV03_00785 [Alphaproteobacteria bacterium]|nr:hypothetical protein [Alphaproteobacteria bacterium]
MKKFFLVSVMMMFSIPALSQVENANEFPSNEWGMDDTLFVDDTVESASNTLVAPAPTASVKSSVATSGTLQGGGLFPELGSDVEHQKKERGSEKILLIIDNVKIVQPALNGRAFCMGTMTLQNDLNIRLQKIDLNMNYGGLDVPLSFSDVSPLGGTQTRKIGWAGSFCDSMLSVPKMEVTSCIARTLSKEQCQAKLQYKPIEGK